MGGRADAAKPACAEVDRFQPGHGARLIAQEDLPDRAEEKARGPGESLSVRIDAHGLRRRMHAGLLPLSASRFRAFPWSRSPRRLHDHDCGARPERQREKPEATSHVNYFAGEVNMIGLSAGRSGEGPFSAGAISSPTRAAHRLCRERFTRLP